MIHTSLKTISSNKMVCNDTSNANKLYQLILRIIAFILRWVFVTCMTNCLYDYIIVFDERICFKGSRTHSCVCTCFFDCLRILLTHMLHAIRVSPLGNNKYLHKFIQCFVANLRQVCVSTHVTSKGKVRNTLSKLKLHKNQQQRRFSSEEYLQYIIYTYVCRL